MKRSVLATFFITPLLWSCQSNSAKFDTAWGVIDAKELAKECVDLQKNNPTKFEINNKYQMLCRDPEVVYKHCSGCEGEKTTKVVYGYMNLHKDGVDISEISPKQASGDRPLDLASAKKPNDTDCDADCWKRRDEAYFASLKEEREQQNNYASAEPYCWKGKESGVYVSVCIEKQNLTCKTEQDRDGDEVVRCIATGTIYGEEIDGNYRATYSDNWKTEDEDEWIYDDIACSWNGSPRRSIKKSPTCQAAIYYGLM